MRRNVNIYYVNQTIRQFYFNFFRATQLTNDTHINQGPYEASIVRVSRQSFDHDVDTAGISFPHTTENSIWPITACFVFVIASSRVSPAEKPPGNSGTVTL
jgi:hypothetical protein